DEHEQRGPDGGRLQLGQDEADHAEQRDDDGAPRDPGRGRPGALQDRPRDARRPVQDRATARETDVEVGHSADSARTGPVTYRRSRRRALARPSPRSATLRAAAPSTAPARAPVQPAAPWGLRRQRSRDAWKR